MSNVPVWTWLPSSVYNHARSDIVFHILYQWWFGDKFPTFSGINKPRLYIIRILVVHLAVINGWFLSMLNMSVPYGVDRGVFKE